MGSWNMNNVSKRNVILYECESFQDQMHGKWMEREKNEYECKKSNEI